MSNITRPPIGKSAFAGGGPIRPMASLNPYGLTGGTAVKTSYGGATSTNPNDNPYGLGAGKPGNGPIKLFGGAPKNLDPSQPGVFDVKTMVQDKAKKEAAAQKRVEELQRRNSRNPHKFMSVNKNGTVDNSKVDEIYQASKAINVPIKQTCGLQFPNKIIKNYEYEQNKQEFAQPNARICMIPPVWTGLPRNVSGTIITVYEEDDTYDVVTDTTSTTKSISLSRIPINFMRAERILCSGKSVQSVDAQHILMGRKYAIPTY